MAGFSIIERRVARLLDNFPMARSASKKVYQTLNYALRREYGFTCESEPGWLISTPAEHARAQGPAKGVAEFFGYFNLSPWSADQDYFLVHRLGKGANQIELGAYDLWRGGYQKIGESPAWNLQQATLAQWCGDLVAFNTLRDGILGASIRDTKGAEQSWVSHPVQELHSATGRAVGVNPLQLQAIGSDYGYAVNASNLVSDPDTSSYGLWLIDLASGLAQLAVAMTDVIRAAPIHEMKGATRQEINHAAIAPAGDKVVFMHRWYNTQGRRSALLSYDFSSGTVTRVLETGMISHYSWVDDTRLILWCRGTDAIDGYHVLDTVSGSLTRFGHAALNRLGDGHPSHHQLTQVTMTDSYPDRARQQHLFLLDANHRQPLARFLAPLRFSGKDRVDLHPRFSPDGKAISVDSGHTGTRQTYIVQRI